MVDEMAQRMIRCSECMALIEPAYLRPHQQWHTRQADAVRRAAKPKCKRCKGSGKQPGYHNLCGRCGGSGNE